jgi:hypothetical protein
MKELLIGLFSLSALVGLPAQSFLEYYDSELITVNYETFGGFSFEQDGAICTAAFGLQQPIRDELASNSKAAPFVRTHMRSMRNGWISLIVGFLADAGAVGSVIAVQGADTDEQRIVRSGIALGLGVSGTLTMVLGALQFHAGYSNLLQAVNIYNRDKIQQYAQR